MIRPEELLTHIQKQPYATRVKILWGTVAVVAVVLLVIWILGLKSTIKHLDTKNILKSAATAPVGTNVNLAAIEGADNTAAGLKLYFNINNQTGDILNFSDPNNITLTVDGQTMNPTKITDRQGQPFVRKVLSHTQNFGIMIFPSVTGSGNLVLDQMYFEQAPEQILSQKLEFDLSKLHKPDNLRN